MIKMLFAFIVVFLLFFFGINTIRKMTGKELWSTTKLLTYSAVCVILTFGSLIALVVLF